MLNSPIAGAIFPKVYFSDGTPTDIPAAIPMLASADTTNGIDRIEYQLDGQTVAVATNWTTAAFALTSRTGTVSVTARVVYSGGRAVTSTARLVQVLASLDQNAEGGVLKAPRYLRKNLYFMEYRTGGGASWYLRQISDVGRNIPPDAVAYTIYLHAYNGGWGRFPFLADEPRRFFWFYRRY
ncbi:MAG: hypothetical protein L6Q38_11555 [Nitrospira sp.]|nr:hypothetical protein [Nitrospira sp.]